MLSDLQLLTPGIVGATLAELPERFRGELIVAIDSLLEATGQEGFLLRELWVFGSCARGDSRWDSDIDLLAIIDERCTSSDCTLQARRILARSRAHLAYDLIALRPSTWAREQDNPCTCYPDIKLERKLLYAR